MAVADMAVSMLLLLLTAVTQAAVALTDSTLTTDQLHTVLCVFGPSHTDTSHQGRNLVVSLLRTTSGVARGVLSKPLPEKDDLQTVERHTGKVT